MNTTTTATVKNSETRFFIKKKKRIHDISISVYYDTFLGVMGDKKYITSRVVKCWDPGIQDPFFYPPLSPA